MIKNFIAFHGADTKVGTTMIAQCVAETMAKRFSDANVLLLCLNGRAGNSYTSEKTTPIDRFKLQIENGLDADLSILNHSKKYSNFYFISGVENEMEERFYFPDMAEKILADTADRFSVIIGDTGSVLDNGLALGGLLQAERSYMIFGQNENCIKRYEFQKSLYEKLGISFDRIIVNRYLANDPYDVKYLALRLGIDENKMFMVPKSDKDRFAEIEAKPLIDYPNQAFSKAIGRLADEIAEKINLGGPWTSADGGKGHGWSRR